MARSGRRDATYSAARVERCCSLGDMECNTLSEKESFSVLKIDDNHNDAKFVHDEGVLVVNLTGRTAIRSTGVCWMWSGVYL